MSNLIKSCCARALERIQGVGELGSALQIFLGASPFILILPDVLPPGSAKEAAVTLGEKAALMTGEKVLGNVTKGVKLPDFADSVRNVNEIVILRMHGYAFMHSTSHPKFSVDGQIWALLTKTYDPEGELRQGSGWDWNPFW